MGVLNVTPDSFSDGGKYLDPDRAFARAIEMEEQGADIIDIGAESTRPGSSRDLRSRRTAPPDSGVEAPAGKLTVPMSVDTYKSAVAEKALEHGAEIINDPSGLTFDAQLARVAANHNAGLILNHMRGTPETWAKLPPLKDVMGSIRHDLDASVHRACTRASIGARIAIDPGSDSENAKNKMQRSWRSSANSPRWIFRSWSARRANLSCRVGKPPRRRSNAPRRPR